MVKGRQFVFNYLIITLHYNAFVYFYVIHFMKRLLLSSFIFTSIFTLAQSTRISELLVTKIGSNSAEIIWTMPSGSTCLDLSVQRSRDSLNFKSVYTYPGVCGSEDKPTSFSWIDNSPITESINYYRLKLENAEFTEIKRIDLRTGLNDSPILIFPNPCSDIIILKLNENLIDKAGIKVIAVNGETVIELIR